MDAKAKWSFVNSWSALRLEEDPVLHAVWAKNVLQEWGPTESFCSNLALVTVTKERLE